MYKRSTVFLTFFSILLFSCDFSGSRPEDNQVALVHTTDKKAAFTEGDSIIAETIKAHGGSLYDKADYNFVFRKKEYHFVNANEAYTYEVSLKINDSKTTKDVLTNGVFTRYSNEKAVQLSEKDEARYSEVLNSVIYFATLPHKLKDAAVNKMYQGTTAIKGEKYHVVKVFFNEEGGGTDHDDTYYYWIHAGTNTVDYLAYNYTVNGGGVRFRSAYNRRNIGGIIFQDYINWKADKHTPLADLPGLYEKGKLKELSKIETENVRSNN